MVTGAAGYIGGQTLLHLRDHGHEVIGIDHKMPLGKVLSTAKTLVADIVGDDSLRWIRDLRPDAVVHCAGTSLVGPSMQYPTDYYHNNFVKTKQLVDHILAVSPKTRFIFSSSASVYGDPIMTPCSEVDPILPISPYGESKAMIEWMLASYARAYGLSYVSFRYFNACGADPLARHGQADQATHVIARVLESIRDHKSFTIYGDRYPTPDGTCVRDYVHVSDIAQAHARALSSQVQSGAYNLGTGWGHSVRQVVDAACRVTGQNLDLVIGNARAGDPAELTASSDHFHKASGWQPQYDLDHMIQHAWNWYNR